VLVRVNNGYLHNQNDGDTILLKITTKKWNFIMTKKQDTVTYEIKEGNKVVYVGATNDPE